MGSVTCVLQEMRGGRAVDAREEERECRERGRGKVRGRNMMGFGEKALKNRDVENERDEGFFSPVQTFSSSCG